MGTNFGTWLFTKFNGEKVGDDRFGNTYYRLSKPGSGARERRWVIYADDREASTVPPEWQGWLTHTLVDPPSEAPPVERPWIKPHQPNLTGSDAAYKPPGALDRANDREQATGDYEPWVPD